MTSDEDNIIVRYLLDDTTYEDDLDGIGTRLFKGDDEIKKVFELDEVVTQGSGKGSVGIENSEVAFEEPGLYFGTDFGNEKSQTLSLSSKNLKFNNEGSEEEGGDEIDSSSVDGKRRDIFRKSRRDFIMEVLSHSRMRVSPEFGFKQITGDKKQLNSSIPFQRGTLEGSGENFGEEYLSDVVGYGFGENLKCSAGSVARETARAEPASRINGVSKFGISGTESIKMSERKLPDGQYLSEDGGEESLVQKEKFTRNSGEISTKAMRLLDEKLGVDAEIIEVGGFSFQTGSGKKVVVNKETMNKGRAILGSFELDSPTVQDHSTGKIFNCSFSTGSGKSVVINRESLEKARSIVGDEARQRQLWVTRLGGEGS